MNFLMTEGEGPLVGSPLFEQRMKALYTVAYDLKFMIKRGASGIDYNVMPLESLHWTAPDGVDRWTLMIMQPELIQKEHALEAIARLSLSSLLRFECLNEGTVAQTLHRGSYDTIQETADKIDAFIKQQSGRPAKELHLIHLHDLRRGLQQKHKIVVRQPFHPEVD